MNTRANVDDSGSELFRAAFHGALEIMVVLDSDRRIVDANEATVAIYGGPREALVGRRVDDFLPPEVREALPDLWAQALAEGVVRGEAPAFTPDGSLLVIEYQTRMNVLADRHLVVGRDVTARRQLEDELRAVFDESVLPMVVVDESQVLIEVNRAALELLGRGRADVIGRPVDELVAFGRPGMGSQGSEARSVGADTLSAEVRIERPDGTVRTAAFFARTDYVPGRHLAMLVDLTERRDLEAQFLQAQKMEVVGRLAAGVAHDFNNLLGVIVGYGEEARAALEKAGGSVVAIEHVLDAARYATGLTKQLLAFGRKQRLQPVVLDVNELVRGTIGLLRRALGETITLRATLEEGIPPVCVDGGQLQQVLLNLAVNARDAMPDGGTLTIETRAETDTASGALEASVVLLAVEDTGIGMQPEAQLRAFEPYYTTKPEGSGLGLSIVYGIVSQSGGRIFLTSREGEGTRFEIRLPAVAPADVPAAASADAEPERPDGVTILLVDEDDQIRRMARRALARHGYSVLEACDAAEALALLETAGTDVGLLVVAGELCNIALADAMRRQQPETPILYTVTYGDHAGLRQVADPGRTALLDKPYTPSMLAAAVAELLAAARAREEGAASPPS